MLLRWYNGGGGLKVAISCLPPSKSSIYIIPVYYITKMVALKLNKLKYFGKTHRPLTFPLDEIGQLRFFLPHVITPCLIGWFIDSPTNPVGPYNRTRKFVFQKAPIFYSRRYYSS